MTQAHARRLEVLRPGNPVVAAFVGFFRDNLDLFLRGLRHFWPIVNLFGWVIVTRNDDVREVLLDNVSFNVEQAGRLKLEMDGVPFMLGIDDRKAHERNVAPMHDAVRPEDFADFARRCGARVALELDKRNGRIEVVDLIRTATFDEFCHYSGVTQPDDPDHDLRIMATRIYEYQVTFIGKDKKLTDQALDFAKELRTHIDKLIEARKSPPEKIEARKSPPEKDRKSRPDDMLARLLAYQGRHHGTPSDAEIRADLAGWVIALPQLPIGAPEAFNQLLARPEELKGAIDCARANDDVGLAGYVFEALRFDPLAPFLVRLCAVEKREIASGTSRASTIKQKAKVLAALQSAMKDPRRLTDPEVFDPRRTWDSYLIFGYGMHSCFIEQLNRLLIPAMLKPLLLRDGLARAAGKRGRLSKRAFIADQLWVTYTPGAAPAAEPPASQATSAGPTLQPA